MRLILHIGTEKTATTTLQHFLLHNKKALLNQRIALLDEILGFPSNRKLAAYCQPQEMYDDYFQQRQISTLADKRRHFANFERDFASAISKASDQADLVIISCEHLHSRLPNLKSITVLQKLLSCYFDTIEIVCYFREQSALALSLYSTAVLTGDSNYFAGFLERVNPGNRYFNYELFFSMWAEIFGIEALRPVLFDPDHFIHGDIRRDFLSRISNEFDVSGIDFDTADENLSLGYVGLELARINNAINPFYTANQKPNMVRKSILDEIKKSKASKMGRVPFPQAADIYRAFDESNICFASKFFGLNKNPFPKPAASSKEPSRDLQMHFSAIIELFNNILECVEVRQLIEDRHASTLRDIAIRIEKDQPLNLDAARDLMEIASLIRPDGVWIQELLNDYQYRLNSRI